MSRQVIPDQNETYGRKNAVWWVSQPGLPLRLLRTLCIGLFVWMLFEEPFQDLAQFRLEPGMQHRIRCRSDAFGSHVSGRRAKEREHLGRSRSDILVWLMLRVAFGLPILPRMRAGLIRPGFILTPQWDAQGLRHAIGQFDQLFFFSV